jgi:hypothetical protein
MCAQKAKFFHETLRLEGEFNASTAWLTRLKHQYSTCGTAVQGEKLGVNDAAANTEVQKLYWKKTWNQIKYTMLDYTGKA